MSEPNSSVGSASHLGEEQVVRDAHFIYDYSRRRVPIPVVSYLAVADSAGVLPPGESPGRKALGLLRDLIEPAVIAEEELNTEHMKQLIRDSLQKINASLAQRPDGQNAPAQTAGPQVSLTMVISDSGKAYIGHAGSTRVYLLRDERLYDLVPIAAGQAPPPSPPPPDDLPQLFPTASLAVSGGIDSPSGLLDQAPVEDAGADRAAPAPSPWERPGGYLGEAPTANIGYNEVEIKQGDVLLLCSDGLWRTVSVEEIVENLTSAMSVQRSSNQLVRLAFSRDASDNATMVAWKYGGEEEPVPGTAVRRGTARRSRGTVAEALLAVLLAVVLAGIFAVGFAFGWRVMDTFRKPDKMASQKQRQERAEIGAREKKLEIAEQSAPSGHSAPAASAAAYPRSATVNGQGVRLRASPDPNGDLVGLLGNGGQVSVLGESMGADSMVWARVKATVRSSGRDVDAEGYVRKDFLAVSQSP